MCSHTYCDLMLSQVLCPRGRLGPKVASVIQHHCTGVIKDSLTPGSEFWDSTKTLKHLLESSYFVAEEKEGEGEGEVEGGVFRWPEVLKSMLSEGELKRSCSIMNYPVLEPTTPCVQRLAADLL